MPAVVACSTRSWPSAAFSESLVVRKVTSKLPPLAAFTWVTSFFAFFRLNFG